MNNCNYFIWSEREYSLRAPLSQVKLTSTCALNERVHRRLVCMRECECVRVCMCVMFFCLSEFVFSFFENVLFCMRECVFYVNSFALFVCTQSYACSLGLHISHYVAA